MSLTFDFMNIFLMTMYIFEFRNPILSKSLKKVFWQFPTKDDATQWARLDSTVQKQADWLFSPKPLTLDDGKKQKKQEWHPNFVPLKSELSKEQKNLAKDQYQFAREYQANNEYDLNYHLTNYVDIKYQTVWSDEFIKEKKWEIKKELRILQIGQVRQPALLHFFPHHNHFGRTFNGCYEIVSLRCYVRFDPSAKNEGWCRCSQAARHPVG